MQGMKNPYKVEIVGVKEDGKKVYGVILPKHSNVGIPDSWGTRQHATKYMAECMLGILYGEYKQLVKEGRI